MTATTRAAFAAFLFAAFVAGTLAPGFASAHSASGLGSHPSQPPIITVKRAAGNAHNAIVVSWDEAHFHGSVTIRHYRIVVFTSDMHYSPGNYGRAQQIMACEPLYAERFPEINNSLTHPTPPGCIRRIVPFNDSGDYSVTISDLKPDTSYSVAVRTFSGDDAMIQRTREDFRRKGINGDSFVGFPSFAATSTITTASAPGRQTTAHTHAYAAARHSHQPQIHAHPYAAAQHVHEAREHTHESTAQEHTHDTAAEHTHDEVPEHTHEPADPETPGPETPEEPETPDPVAETCTYKHRLMAVPGTTANAYAGRILVSSELPNATATLRAYQADNGHRIDVLDSDGRAVETVSLAPARSVKRFRIEGIRGWHPVTVEHPSESAMTAASVAMRLREPGGSIEDSYPPGIKHCEPTTDTGPVTETGTTAPDLAVRDAQALLWPATLDWRATVENIGDGRATKTRIRLYYGERELASQDVRQALAAGAQWPMSHAVTRSAVTVPRAGSQVRICVDPVPGEPESKRANNCASVTVELN